MNRNRGLIGVFVLAKNEGVNIGRCVASLAATEWDICVLDSGSIDDTRAIAERFTRVRVEPYSYIDHCTAYNDILLRLGAKFRAVVVLDADMVLTSALVEEIDHRVDGDGTEWDALCAPVEMWVEGVPMKAGSLYPRKPILLKTGAARFVRIGHAEALVEGTRIGRLNAVLRHDDRKSYTSFLLSQKRYADKLVERYRQHEVGVKDRLRIWTPLLMLTVPFVSLIVRMGFLSGRAGALYALDRLIAEAIMYRCGLAMRVSDAGSGGIDDV